MRVDAEFVRVRGYVEERFDSVVYGCWEREFRCEMVFHAHEDGVHLFRDCPGPACIVRCAAETESSPMEVDDNGVSRSQLPALFIALWGVESEFQGPGVTM